MTVCKELRKIAFHARARYHWYHVPEITEKKKTLENVATTRCYSLELKRQLVQLPSQYLFQIHFKVGFEINILI